VPEDKDYTHFLNEASLEIISEAKVEPCLADALPGDRCQFERVGYFCVDTKHAKPGKPVFNRTVGLKDTWAKTQQKA
jgi:glutaminyl-tRNA synthetase